MKYIASKFAPYTPRGISLAAVAISMTTIGLALPASSALAALDTEAARVQKVDMTATHENMSTEEMRVKCTAMRDQMKEKMANGGMMSGDTKQQDGGGMMSGDHKMHKGGMMSGDGMKHEGGKMMTPEMKEMHEKCMEVMPEMREMHKNCMQMKQGAAGEGMMSEENKQAMHERCMFVPAAEESEASETETGDEHSHDH